MNQESNQNYLIHKNEKMYYRLALMISIIEYIALFLSVVGIFFLVAMIAVPLFVHGLMMAYIRTNGVRLSPKQFPAVFAKIEEICERMELNKVPDVYVIESSGALNAFATRFFKRDMIVLYSDIFDLINSGAEDELSFVIAHELAHIKRKHISKQILILPAMWIPLLGEAYSRACEYTCDRMAAYYTDNSVAAVNGLTILAIGKSLYKQVDRNEYLEQARGEKGLFIWLAEKLSTHPPLPKRIHEIDLFMWNKDFPGFSYDQNSKRTWVLAVAAIFIFLIINGGGLYIALNELPVDIFSESSSDEVSEIFRVVAEDKPEEVKKQLEIGVNPNIQDSDGWTPLMWAAQDNNTELIKILIAAGADPNLLDFEEGTALDKAVAQGNVEAIKALAEAGVDINLQDSYGWTALMMAARDGQIESVKALLEVGADPKIEDSEKMTAFMQAKKAGHKEIAELLKEIR